MKKVFFYLLFIVLVSCNSNYTKDDYVNNTSVKHDSITNILIKNKNISFIDSNYTISSRKKDIPKLLLNYIRKTAKNDFNIADSTEIDKVTFSDATINIKYINKKPQKYNIKYNKLLYFVAFDSDTYILSYRTAGISSHNVLKIFNYKDSLSCIEEYRTNEIINDIEHVKIFLSNYNHSWEHKETVPNLDSLYF